MLNKLYLGFYVFSLCSILIFISGSLPLVQAQSVSGTVKQVRIVEDDDFISEQTFAATSSDILELDVVAYPPYANTLLKLDPEAEEDVSLILAAPPAPEDTDGRTNLTTIDIIDPINIAFDPASEGAKGFKVPRLFQLDAGDRQLVSYEGGAQGEVVGESSELVNVQGPSIADPQGATLDPDSGTIYMLDAVEQRIVRLTSKMGRNFDGAVASPIDLPGSLGIPRGLAFNPEDSHLYMINPDQKTLYKLNLESDVVAEFHIPYVGELQGMIFALSLDGTDSPLAYHLYIAAEIDSMGNKGEVTEWALPDSSSLRANLLEE